MARLKFSVLIIFFVCIHAQKLNGQNLELSFQIKGLENKTIVTGYYEGCKQFLKDTLKLNEEAKHHG